MGRLFGAFGSLVGEENVKIKKETVWIFGSLQH